MTPEGSQSPDQRTDFSNNMPRSNYTGPAETQSQYRPTSHYTQGTHQDTRCTKSAANRFAPMLPTA